MSPEEMSQPEVGPEPEIPGKIIPANLPTEYIKGAAGDHDEPYQFGRTPTVKWPTPFTERQFARLLIVRGRIRAEKETNGPD